MRAVLSGDAKDWLGEGARGLGWKDLRRERVCLREEGEEGDG